MAVTTSKVVIWNMALGNIGSGSAVENETEQSNEANQCKLYWDTCRRLVLRAYPWSFATKQAVLASTGTPPTGWKCQYIYPPDCLNARSIFLDKAIDANPIKYQIAKNPDEAGKVIWTDQAQAQLIYTVDVTDVSLFDDEFVEAIAYCLAQKLAMPLRADKDLLGDMLRMKLIALAEATEDDANEDFHDKDRQASWIEDRL